MRRCDDGDVKNYDVTRGPGVHDARANRLADEAFAAENDDGFADLHDDGRG